jgi:small multidrug resistance pump
LPAHNQDLAMSGYVYLAIAICAEVVATTSMKALAGFNRPLPLLLVVTGYSLSFWMLALVVRTIPVGIAYAIWAGLGIVLVSVAAAVLYRQYLDLPAVLGMGMIIAGVVVIQLFSRSAGH